MLKRVFTKNHAGMLRLCEAGRAPQGMKLGRRRLKSVEVGLSELTIGGATQP